jgi:quinohemoprotein amine dehydrogenase alpha subunit
MRKRFMVGIFYLLSCILLLPITAVFGASVFPPDSIVRQKCSACHKPDEKGQVEVIEETRKSPEEWKAVVDRMIRLNSAPLPEGDFYPIIKELSRYLGLSPKEMSQVAYINSDENSQYREIPKNKLEERIYAACVRCHTFGKIASHRNTKAHWAEIRNMHLGYYPTAVPQMREMDWVKESEELIAPLTDMFPFDAPEWKQWMTGRKAQDLTGKWQMAGYQPGFGYYTGTVTFGPDTQKGIDEYHITRRVQYENGIDLVQEGTATLYSQYHLRYALAPTGLIGRVEGVFDLNAESMGFSGKWWAVVQDANAFGNEKFYRSDAPARVFALIPAALQSGTGKNHSLTLAGVNLPETLAPGDIKSSDPHVAVTDVAKTDAGNLQCKVSIGKEAALGKVNLQIKGVDVDHGLVVFDKVDSIQIRPFIGRARVNSGAAYPPQGVQFVARGTNNGPDGKPGTEDDLILEPVDVKWWLEEEKTRENDDDLQYLAAPIANGLYTPVTNYGPIENRHQRRGGVGLIAVGAEVKVGDKTLKDRARLVVTVPDFIPQIK